MPGKTNRSGRGRARAGAALAAVTAAIVSGAGAPAVAHESDPAIRTILDTVEPAVSGVTIDVVANVTPQLVAENTTPTELVVLADTGEPFLRIGPDGVLANLDSPSWYLSNSPNASVDVPDSARPDAPPRWARVSTEPTWGWFDHRLHPQARAVPPAVVEEGEPVTLADWSVSFDYGGGRVEARGRIEFRPVRGSVTAQLRGSAEPLAGVLVQLSPGRLPALFVRNTGAEPVVVLGAGGEPFLRLGPAGAEVNAHSPTWIDTARALDRDVTVAEAVADVAATPEWVAVSSSPSFTWLEARGAYTREEPPSDVIDRPALLSEWSVPLVRGDEQATIAAETRWQPVPTPGDDGNGGGGGRAVVLVLVVVAVVVAGAALAAALRRRSPASRRR